MSKVIKGIVRLRVNAGKAAPSPAIGQSLGPLGVNMMEFCKEFNNRTSGFNDDVPIPVVLTAFDNRTFEFYTKTPTTSWLLKRSLGLKKGAATPGDSVVGSITLKHVYEIAQIKMQDPHLAALGEEAVCKQVIGTASTMGVSIADIEMF